MSGIGFAASAKDKKHRKVSDVSGLTVRQRKYLANRANVRKYKTKKAAALASGYSEETAENAAQLIETPKVRAVWEAIVRNEFDDQELLRGLRDGTQATKATFATLEGQITDVVEVADYTERRKNIELISEMSGRLQRRGSSRVNVGVNIPVKVVVEHVGRTQNQVSAKTERVAGAVER